VRQNLSTALMPGTFMVAVARERELNHEMKKWAHVQSPTTSQDRFTYIAHHLLSAEACLPAQAAIAIAIEDHSQQHNTKS